MELDDMFLFQEAQLNGQNTTKKEWNTMNVNNNKNTITLQNAQQIGTKIIDLKENRGELTHDQANAKRVEVSTQTTVEGVENLMKKWGYFGLYQKELQQQQEREKPQKTQTAPRIENSQTKNLASEKRVDDLQKQGEFVNDHLGA